MIQKLINIIYRYPQSALKKYKRFGGYLNYRSIIKAGRQMEKSSFNLPAVNSYTDGLSIYFLTGEKFLSQTLFCIQSLIKVTETKFRFVLVDDGSFTDSIILRINKQLPGASVMTKSIIEKKLQTHLPAHLFPNLHHKRSVYPHIKKLTDIHILGENSWKLVLDSDMLFWAEPKAIIDWLSKPDKPLYMLDCQNSYGYSQNLMENLCSKKIPDLLNVGVIGLNSEDFDWVQIDKWVEILEEKEGSSYYLEQALTAMLIGKGNAAILSSDDYIVNPDITAIKTIKGILHHYVDLSKEGYLKNAWRKI